MLHGQWEVEISEIQFLCICTFLHVRHNENVIRFVDVKSNEGTNGTAKEVAFPNGIYNDIHEFIDAINIACKDTEIEFLFRTAKTSDDKVFISINYDEKCKMLY